MIVELHWQVAKRNTSYSVFIIQSNIYLFTFTMPLL
jgi:hypothetical protein